MTYKKFLLNLYPQIRKHLGKLILTSVLMISSTLLESAIPEITGQIVDKLFGETRDGSNAILFSIGLFLVILTSSIFAISSTAISSWVANIVVMNLRKQMFHTLLRLPKAYLDRNSSGSIMSKIIYDVEQIAGAASTLWLDFIKALVMVIALSIYLFYKSWELSIGLIVILPLIYYAVYISAIRMRRSSKNVQASMGQMTHKLKENINGNMIIKVFNAKNQESDKFFEIIKNIRQQKFKVDITSTLNSNLINILLGIGLSAVVYLASLFFKLTAGEFLSYFTALAMLIKPAKNLVNINKPLQNAMAAGESVFGFLNEKIETEIGKRVVKKIKGEITFKNVSFSYVKNVQTLKNFSFKISPGEKVAIVGPTGSGKTTIIELLTRMYESYEGKILIDGEDIKSINIDTFRSNISLVDQNIYLFNESIKENITFGSDINLNTNELQEVAKISGSDEFINKLSNKYDEIVGEDGSLLSGGQKQRIAIARAVAKKSPILILDEATSALDATTEKFVQQAINEISKTRTLIIIAHRLSTIQNADVIVVMNNGDMIESGTHKELIAKDGFYKNLIKDQFS